MAHILTIDDNEARQKWFLRALVSAGHELRQAFDAEMALEQFQETRFDLAFFDHDLGPGDNGSQLAFKIFSDPDRYKKPGAVWVQSSNPVGCQNILAKCKSAEVPCLAVPFEELVTDRAGFLKAVLSVLDGSRL
jgi:CheY-like chemotaxis protein